MPVDYHENNSWTVYVHIVPQKISGYDYDKYYVGITSQLSKQRWRNGKGYYSRKNNHFWNAIQKYGWDNIEHEIIAEHLTEDEAKDFEKALIKELDSNNKKYGYNLTCGGDGVIGLKMSEESKKLISNKNKKVWENIEYKKSRSGKNHYLYGIHKQVCEHEPYKRKVICLNDGKEYEAITYAANKYKCSLSHILNTCAGRSRYAGYYKSGEKLVWVYKDDYDNLSLNDIYSRLDLANKRVVNKDTKEVYININTATKKYTNKKSANIYHAITGKCKTAYGYRWQYLSDYLKENNLSNEEARKSLIFIA